MELMHILLEIDIWMEDHKVNSMVHGSHMHEPLYLKPLRKAVLPGVFMAPYDDFIVVR